MPIISLLFFLQVLQGVTDWEVTIGACTPQDSGLVALADTADNLETCQQRCDSDPSCAYFIFSDLRGPAHVPYGWQTRCQTYSATRGCNDEERQIAYDYYDIIGVPCCRDKSCPNGQMIDGAVGNYKSIWLCYETYIKPEMVPQRSPTSNPSGVPTFAPSSNPTQNPTVDPTRSPTGTPTTEPTHQPTRSPAMKPTQSPIGPTKIPTQSPTFILTGEPTTKPTYLPTNLQTMHPSNNPTNLPTLTPALPPTDPTKIPTQSPTFIPTGEPTTKPTYLPTNLPTMHPSNNPTNLPTLTPTLPPTGGPTKLPTRPPTVRPTFIPSGQPTSTQLANLPSTMPARSPSGQPSQTPTTDVWLGKDACPGSIGRNSFCYVSLESSAFQCAMQQDCDFTTTAEEVDYTDSSHCFTTEMTKKDCVAVGGEFGSVLSTVGYSVEGCLTKTSGSETCTSDANQKTRVQEKKYQVTSGHKLCVYTFAAYCTGAKFYEAHRLVREIPIDSVCEHAVAFSNYPHCSDLTNNLKLEKSSNSLLSLAYITLMLVLIAV